MNDLFQGFKIICVYTNVKEKPNGDWTDNLEKH